MACFHLDKVGYGKTFTLKPRQRLVSYAFRKLIERRTEPRMFLLVICADGSSFRYLVQLCPFLLTWITLDWVTGYDFVFFYAAWLAALFADDLLTADDDLKKKWDSVKNKVKWLWTPAMEPVKVRL